LSNDRKALKSGVWYTAASFLRRGIGFLTTPIFVRLMTQEEFGLYSNYASWESIISVIVGLGLGATLIHARYEYESDFDSYIFSMNVLNAISTAVWFGIVCLFSDFFSKTFSMSPYYLKIMCVTLLLHPIIDMYMDRERFFFEYKKSVLLSVAVSVLTTGLSVALVVAMEDRLNGRILGGILPIIPIGLALHMYFYRKGKRVQVKYWKAALPVSLPYIPHVLSLILLSSMDRTMITRLCGPEDNAIYSLAYSVSSVITMLVGSMNSAFAPWIGEKLHEKKFGDINRVSRVYMLAFVAMASLIVLAAPEVIAIVGGAKYREGIWVLPPVAAGVMLQFLYCLFVNVEQFEKKTTGMAFASVSAALLNWGLNAYFIPRYGYIAAAYTTFAGYLWMLLVHMFLVVHYGYKEVYDNRLVLALVGVITVVMFGATWLYGQPVIRYIVLGVYALALGIVFMKKKDLVLGLFRKRKD